MARRTQDRFQTIRTEGGLLPPELLKRIAEGDRDLPGLTPADYHLEENARLPEAVTRSWNRLRGAWQSFREAHTRLAPGAPDAGLTRDRWLLVLFQELGYGRLLTARGIEIDGKSFPISHRWNRSPIHLVGFGTDIGTKTAGVAGAARQSPHSLVQDALNRSPEMRWGFVSNGRVLRVLRDNATLTRQAYVEFDLESMLTAEAYADFALLWLVCHQSRVEADRSDQCWLERWAQAGREQGTRALDRLRDGVTETIAALGRGFLANPKNAALREALGSGALDKQEYYRELLRLVYRLIFLFVSEDRGLLLDPDAKPDATQRYLEHYSSARLRRLARRRGGPHPDGWRALCLVMEKLGDDAGCPALALPALGSFLWSREALPHLVDAELANEHLYESVRTLAYTERDRLLRGVDWRNLGSEELGSVYESLLELHPEVDAGAAHFSLTSAAGHERKTTGSYYTPDSLVQCLLDTALDPVLNEACAKPDPERALLALKVCDPAVGSGHFLIAAARRIARRLAQMRTEDAEPDPDAMQRAMRDVISHCLYGVDLNPMAVELCKVSLWLEAIEPGRPLSFLDHHLQVGNSLLGTTPALIANGVPDDAWEPIEGDDKKVASGLRTRNKKERAGERTLFAEFARGAEARYGTLTTIATQLDALPDGTLADVRAKEARWRRLVESADALRERLRADAWCAAFMWPKRKGAPEAPTEEIFRRLKTDSGSVPASTRAEIGRLAERYQFFHWHLAFPDVFRVPEDGEPESADCGWSGGFDVLLGNPPWATLSPDVKEFFSASQPEVRFQDPQGQARIIAELLEVPEIAAAWEEHRRTLFAQVHFLKDSGRYRLFAPGNLGKGDFNVFRMFVEVALSTVRRRGRAAQIVPEGLYNGANCMAIRNELFEAFTLECIYGFENTREVWFSGVDSRAKFAIYCAILSGSTVHFRAAFNIRSLSDLPGQSAREELGNL